MPHRPSGPHIQARLFRTRLTWLLILAAAVYLIGNERVPLWDRDEPRYAQTSRQMLTSGNWVVPRFLDQVRTAKPPFIYWCQAAAMKLLASDSAFAARLPSAVAMVITIAFVTLWLQARVGRRRAIWTGFIFASSALVIAAAKMCLTDSVLLLWVTVAQIGLYQIVRGRGIWKVWIAMGVTVGCAGLTKGPVVMGTMGAALIVYFLLGWKRGEQHYPLREYPSRLNGVVWGKMLAAGVIVAIICLPWLVLIHQREPKFLPRIIGHDVVSRIGSGLEGHKGPPGYYLLLIWGTYFPWSLLLPGAIVYAWKHRADPLTRFALASVIGPWLMFEIVQTKLPHYVLPIFPWLALLTARMLLRQVDRTRRAFVTIAAVWGGIVALIYGGVLPLVPQLQVSRRIADLLRQHEATRPGDVIMIDYKEPSLAFYQGGTIREESNDNYLVETNPERWPHWIVLTRRVWDGLPPSVRGELEVVDSPIAGWWYPKGRRVEVLVVGKRQH
jgi:4-amino-4-deoxy-L-arabinose transferase-like glycosyltransferase